MRRTTAIAGCLVVFGWMLFAGVFFLAENPGCLGPLAAPLAELLQLPAIDAPLHNPLRILDRMAASISARSFQRWPAEIAGALAFAIWLLAVCLGSGLMLLRALRLQGLASLEGFAVASSLGLGLWGTVIFLMGVARLFHPAAFVVVLAAATVLVLPCLIRWIKDFARKGLVRPHGLVEWATAALAAAALLLGLIYTLTPAIQSDGLRYHLAVPQAYLREHRIFYLPFNAFSNFPFLIEMLFTLGLGVAGDLAAKMVHFSCFVLCGAFLALLSAQLFEGLAALSARPVGQRPVGDATGAGPTDSAFRSPLLAPMLFWTTPAALHVAAWEFIDVGTALFFVATIHALSRWHRAADDREKRRWRLVAALFVGFLIGTKYTMLAMLVLVPLALLFELPSFAPSGRWDFGQWIRSSAVVVVVASAAASPWLIKNTIYTGNPLYPLAWSVFGGGEWSAENTARYLEQSSKKGYHPRRDRTHAQIVRHAILTPWDSTIHWKTEPGHGKPGDPDYSPPNPRYEDFSLGPLYLLWLPLLLRVLMDVKGRAAALGPLRLLVFFTLAYGGFWYFTYQSNRLLIPALATLSVLAAHSLAVADRTSRALARTAAVVVLGISVFNLEFAAEWVFRETNPAFPGGPAKPSPAAYALGFQSRDDYIRKAFPPYGIYQLMPQHVGDGEKVLFVGEYRPFHCPAAWQSSDWFDTPLILHYIRTTPDNDALLDRLLGEGVSWVFYNDLELSLYEQDAFFPRFTEGQRQRFLELFQRRPAADGSVTVQTHPRLELVLSHAGMYLYTIRQR